jgi:hypothetical protein
MKHLWMILGSFAMAMTAAATTYVREEADGSKTYSDRPIPGGKPVELQPAQSYSAPPAPANNQSVPREQRLLQEMDDFTYQSCRLTPENSATFTNPENVSITFSATPELRGEDTVTMTVDGQPVTAAGGAYVLSPAHRGAHTVQVTVKDRYGRQLCNASTTFHVFRPSVNLPNRR